MWQLDPQNSSLLFNLLLIAEFCLYLSKKGQSETGTQRLLMCLYSRTSKQHLAKSHFQSVKFPPSLLWSLHFIVKANYGCNNFFQQSSHQPVNYRAAQQMTQYNCCGKNKCSLKSLSLYWRRFNITRAGGKGLYTVCWFLKTFPLSCVSSRHAFSRCAS